MVETMQYRDFLFRHNPQCITVYQPSQVASHFCPGWGDMTQQLGGKARTVRCQGSFFGGNFPEAMSQLQEFRGKTGDGERGMLLIPGLSPFMAYLKELVFDAQGDGRIIPYTMVFVEARAVSP